MFVLKCEFCGYKQTIERKIDKYTYYELTHCKHLWCPCNKCKEQNPRPRIIENGFIKHGWVLGEWDCILTEKDAAYVQPYQDYGNWSKIINPTIDQCKSILKAKYLRDVGMTTIITKEEL